MKNELSFKIPFAGYTSTDFYNCFASVYMYLENIKFDDNYECKKHDGMPCDDCGNCNNTAKNIQTDIYFLFDTMSGHSSLRNRFDGELSEMEKLIDEHGGTDYTISFLFGFTGYEYSKLTDNTKFKDAIVSSIDTGKPIIAMVKTGDCRFRVITGYDVDALIEPSYKSAQNRPKHALAYNELEELYIVGTKVRPCYTLKDGLKRIQKVMEYNVNERLWDGHIAKLNYDGLEKADFEEIRNRVKRVQDTMWHTFNCHNFAETFRHCVYEEMRNPAFIETWSRISGLYGDTHDLAWSIIGLYDWRDWSKRRHDGLERGMCDLVIMVIEKIKQKDIEVLSEIKHMHYLLHDLSQQNNRKQIVI